MTPIPFHPIRVFDETKHVVDVVAAKYIQKATDDLRYLIPVNVGADGNCLYHSIVLLIWTILFPLFATKSHRMRTDTHIHSSNSAQMSILNIVYAYLDL